MIGRCRSSTALSEQLGAFLLENGASCPTIDSCVVRHLSAAETALSDKQYEQLQATIFEE